MCQSHCLSRPSLLHSAWSLCRLDHPRLVKGPSRRYPANLSLDALSPTPAAPKVLLPVASLWTAAFPGFTAGRRLTWFRAATSARGRITGLQTFRYVKASSFACHPGRSHRGRLFQASPVVRFRMRVSNSTLSIVEWGHSSSLALPGPALHCRAAMTFTSEQNMVRYLPIHRIY